MSVMIEEDTLPQESASMHSGNIPNVPTKDIFIIPSNDPISPYVGVLRLGGHNYLSIANYVYSSVTLPCVTVNPGTGKKTRRLHETIEEARPPVALELFKANYEACMYVYNKEGKKSVVLNKPPPPELKALEPFTQEQAEEAFKKKRRQTSTLYGYKYLVEQLQKYAYGAIQHRFGSSSAESRSLTETLLQSGTKPIIYDNENDPFLGFNWRAFTSLSPEQRSGVNLGLNLYGGLLTVYRDQVRRELPLTQMVSSSVVLKWSSKKTDRLSKDLASFYSYLGQPRPGYTIAQVTTLTEADDEELELSPVSTMTTQRNIVTFEMVKYMIDEIYDCKDVIILHEKNIPAPPQAFKTRVKKALKVQYGERLDISSAALDYMWIYISKSVDILVGQETNPKTIENGIKFIQDKLYEEKCGDDSLNINQVLLGDEKCVFRAITYLIIALSDWLEIDTVGKKELSCVLDLLLSSDSQQNDIEEMVTDYKGGKLVRDELQVQNDEKLYLLLLNFCNQNNLKLNPDGVKNTFGLVVEYLGSLMQDKTGVGLRVKFFSRDI